MPSSNIDYSKESIEYNYSINTGFGENQSRVIPILLWIGLLGWVARVTLFVRQRSGLAFTSVDLHAVAQILIVFVILLLILSNSRLSKLIFRIKRTSLAMLFTYYIVCAFSTLWSVFPFYTLYRAVEFLTLLMGTSIALSYSSDFVKAERIILFVSSVVITFCIGMHIKLGGFSFSISEWHATTYTTSGAMIFCYCFGEYFFSEKVRKKTLKRYGFFALAVLLLGTSSGSFIATFCGLILILFLHRNAGVLILVAGLLLVILIIGVDWAPVWDFVFYGKSERAISTLHGRLPMWQRLLELVSENIFLGTGFGVFMRSADLATAGHPHNSLISVLMGTGILGAIPVVIFFFRLLREFLKTTGRRLPGAIGCTAAISTGLINSLASPFVLDKWDESTLVFACIIALFILFVVSSQNLRDK